MVLTKQPTALLAAVRLGYQTAKWKGLDFRIEFEGTQSWLAIIMIGPDQVVILATQ